MRSMLARSRGDDTAGTAQQPPARVQRRRIPSWTAGEALAGATVRALLWLLVACGPLALVLWVLAAPVAPARPTAPATESGQARQVVTEAAESGVLAWLTIPRDKAGDLRAWFPGASDEVQLPPAPADVEHVATAAASPDPRQPGVWSVVVGADVAPAGQKSHVRRYFQVPVAYAATLADRSPDPAQVALLTLPAPVAGPTYRPGATAAAYPQRMASNSAVGQTAEAFIAALTAGQGDITRLTSPNSQIRAIQPATATSVRLTGLATDVPVSPDTVASAPEAAQIRVLATADLLDKAGDALTSQYGLTLTARAGRWEVSQIDPAPMGAATAAPAGPTPSPAAAGTPKETP